LAQKLTMSIPDHAIVATALPLVDGGPRRLVHGVLGNLLRRPLSASDSPPLPDAVERRWRKAWGDAMVGAARRQIVHRPPLDLTFANQAQASAFAKDHGGASLAPGHVRLPSQSVAGLPDFEDGGYWVQDLAASLPARLIPKDAQHVLDACAAPGGKTMQLAAAGHRVLALDRSEGRLQRLSENIARTGLSAQIELGDAFQWNPPGPFDAILLDAPCSATGTFRRHPEVIYRVGQNFIHEAADAQLKLLTRAREWVRPSGKLVYSVCSLEPQEGEKVVQDFLAANPEFSIEPPQAGELPDFVTPSPEGWVRILPGLLKSDGDLDGFFVARLVRAAR
jgi:16S rRNA (cytosine967-C5)-methyltransferase